MGFKKKTRKDRAENASGEGSPLLLLLLSKIITKKVHLSLSVVDYALRGGVDEAESDQVPQGRHVGTGVTAVRMVRMLALCLVAVAMVVMVGRCRRRLTRRREQPNEAF